MPRVNSGGGVLRVPGIYRRLLEDERERCERLEPQLLFGTLAADPKVYRRSTVLRDALEAGEPVRVPVWMLGGHMVRDERIRDLRRGDRSITGWIVHPNDTVIAARGDGCGD